MGEVRFEWDDAKDRLNRVKHGVRFELAQRAFLDPQRVIVEDPKHSSSEDRYYCIGRVGEGILTVRFTFRNKVIRLIGAGFWRRGKQIYEAKDCLY